MSGITPFDLFGSARDVVELVLLQAEEKGLPCLLGALVLDAISVPGRERVELLAGDGRIVITVTEEGVHLIGFCGDEILEYDERLGDVCLMSRIWIRCVLEDVLDSRPTALSDDGDDHLRVIPHREGYTILHALPGEEHSVYELHELPSALRPRVERIIAASA